MPEELFGHKLAEAAYLHARYRDPGRTGMEIEQLATELESSGIRIRGDDPSMTLRSALNQAQDVWVNAGDGLWCWIEIRRPVGTELSGRALSDAVYAFVQQRYPNDRIFHYEQAKEQLMKTGVRIKGSATGPTMRAALAGSPDRFEKAPSGVRGWWRWKVGTK